MSTKTTVYSAIDNALASSILSPYIVTHFVHFKPFRTDKEAGVSLVETELIITFQTDISWKRIEEMNPQLKCTLYSLAGKYIALYIGLITFNNRAYEQNYARKISVKITFIVKEGST